MPDRERELQSGLATMASDDITRQLLNNLFYSDF